jgi:hypothetical protein
VNNDNLEQVIGALNAEKHIYAPFAGIHELVDGRNEHNEYGYAIKANKEGLIQLAIILIDAARQDYRYDGPKVIHLDIDDKINPGTDGLLPQKIELSANVPVEENGKRKKESWAQRTLPIAGCLIILAFILVSLIAGVVTVFKWFF